MISVVIPFWNEERLIERFLKATITALQETGQPYELICVDDGSTDATLDILMQMHQLDKAVKILSLSRNYGLQAALTAGLDYAKGDWVVMMDGDFQDPPELLSLLFEKMQSSKADIVTAIRKTRNDTFPRNLYISVFHRIFEALTKGQQISQTGNFCVLNKKAHDAIQKFSERNRYLPGIRNMIGFKHEFIHYNRPNRPEGKSRMSIRMLFSLGADAIYSFTKWPIRACLYLGLLGIFTFSAAIVYTLVSKYLGLAPVGWSSMFLAISFFGSIQLTFLGLIGEYIFRIFKEVQARPIYLVKDVYE